MDAATTMIANPLSDAVSWLQKHPFGTMALSNILGDFCYLGYAFGQGMEHPSAVNLAGSACAMLAHTAMLAYGDGAVSAVAEGGFAARAVSSMRTCALALSRFAFPGRLGRIVASKPVGIPFAAISVNGFCLLSDALSGGAGGAAQALLGFLVASGCLAMSAADFTPSQPLSDIYVRTAAKLLSFATAMSAVTGIVTGNAFMAATALMFVISNVAMFYARLDKRMS